MSGDKYKDLISNTLLFGLSNFGSKLLVFLMMPVYTRMLTTDEYGVYNLVADTCYLIVPLMSLCVHEAVVRFGLESTSRKRDVFSTAILTVFGGYIVLFCAWPLISRIDKVSDYTLYIYIFILTSALRAVVTSFVRACGFRRLFALDGLFTNITTIGFNILFLVRFGMGVTGFVLSTILADAISALGLILMLRLYRFFRFKVDGNTARRMLAYCIPLTPTAAFWWITNLSDRYFIFYMVGEDVTGLYSAAGNIPRIITIVSAIFIQAWQLSAFTEYKSKDGERFYSTVFKSYYTLIFLAASGIMMIIKPITRMLVAPGYYESWRYVPFLLLGAGFSCLVTFYGTVYNAAKKNGMVTLTTFIGAVVNLLLNRLLIPIFGADGAAFTTFLSYFVVFLIRAVDSRKYSNIKMQPARLTLNLVLLLLQCWIGLTEPFLWRLWECLIFLALAVINLGNLVFILKRMLKMLRR